ncbi:triphosphoribosyl-dephospho-CoA synthase CitG [Dickeya chrysanthemi]|uniref:Probable 2-(5''-triphosphoribosyl)-3'-dephosphocoenzyme-A synthase n=1 Tax=Dickeya chrysanthemi TaxID=556 RepID=A0ABU8JKR5_DICCH|nr:triphosphoribosyl-dephospho-CoA synthase CitG [Dickeya chrysanthemi]MBX9445020.1 triphosphoribosyl-dephospho-CoA synthase CitG [Dickeya chrysanthemi]MCA7007471.1 triphosphoribosyl-dephospho-CoA synthase CitG [Dickeya chrysanthemi]
MPGLTHTESAAPSPLLTTLFPDATGALVALPNIHQWVVAALTVEVMLTPKPGLVDRDNNGAHRDMDVPLFQASIAALTPWFARFTEAGVAHSALPITQLLPQVRPIGIAAEQSMLAATGGVNTHKGGIFAFGLLCSAAGWLAGRRQRLTQDSLCECVAQMSADLVRNELENSQHTATAGEHLFRRHGLTGARGEAASGFATVRRYALPVYLSARAQGKDEESALLQALVVLMAHNPDTNVVSRGGIDGLTFVQTYARTLLSDGVTHQGLQEMNRALVARNVSPGGSADLLALTWLLSHYPAV